MHFIYQSVKETLIAIPPGGQPCRPWPYQDEQTCVIFLLWVISHHRLQQRGSLRCSWTWSRGTTRPTWRSLKRLWGASKWRACSGAPVSRLPLTILRKKNSGQWGFDSSRAVVFGLRAAKLIPVGYGIKKLQIMMTIVDDLVSVDTLIEEHLTVEPANEYIQSCDIVAFNKICECPVDLADRLFSSGHSQRRSMSVVIIRWWLFIALPFTRCVSLAAELLCRRKGRATMFLWTLCFSLYISLSTLPIYRTSGCERLGIFWDFVYLFLHLSLILFDWLAFVLADIWWEIWSLPMA